MTKDLISVMLVDDHPVVRDGYRRLLENEPDFKVVAEADDGEAACAQYEKLKPSVVVLDLTMPGIGGLETIRRLRAKDSNAIVLIFTMHDSRAMVNHAREAGASGYLTKSCSTTHMIEAIRRLSAGESLFNYGLSTEISTLQDDGIIENLTKREFQVFRALAEGQSVFDIAHSISISPKTVGVHQTKIMKKLGLKNSAELTRLAIRDGIVEP